MGSITLELCLKKPARFFGPSHHPGEMIHHPALTTCQNTGKEKGSYGQVSSEEEGQYIFNKGLFKDNLISVFTCVKEVTEIQV